MQAEQSTHQHRKRKWLGKNDSQFGQKEVKGLGDLLCRCPSLIERRYRYLGYYFLDEVEIATQIHQRSSRFGKVSLKLAGERR